MQPNGSAAPGAGTGNNDSGAAPEQPISDAEVDGKVISLAGLSDLAYGRQRKDAAAGIGLSVAWLDKLVRSKKAEIVAQAAGVSDADTGGQGRAVNLPEPEPWTEPVDGAKLLSGITATLTRFMVMEDGAAESVALWVVHTHATEAFGITPRLAITSPRPGCGKTTLLDLLYRLVVRPLLAANVSAPTVFRVVEVAHPTLLIDEADTFLNGNDELRGVLNSGHRRGGNVLRVVGEDMEVREFATFSPAAIAQIGNLPGTLADRSVAITLKRKRPDEVVENFRYDRTEDLDRLARMCARWASDHVRELRRADPAVPSNLYNRAADNWRPLLAIADAAGGEWPERARAVAARAVDVDQAKRVGLLADIRAVFEARPEEQIKSADLVASLVAMEGHPWAEFGRAGKPLSPNGLARMLAGDHITPDTIRFGDALAKGYRRRQFEDVFTRYLPPLRNPTVTPLQPEDSCGFPANSQPLQPDLCYGLENPQNASIPASCYGVTDEKPEEAPKSARRRFSL